jgi:hypothetical protein
MDLLKSIGGYGNSNAMDKIGSNLGMANDSVKNYVSRAVVVIPKLVSGYGCDDIYK